MLLGGAVNMSPVCSVMVAMFLVYDGGMLGVRGMLSVVGWWSFGHF